MMNMIKQQLLLLLLLLQLLLLLLLLIIIKLTIHVTTGGDYAVTEERRRYSFNTLGKSAHIGVGGQHEAPAILLPEKIRYPFYRRISGVPGRYGNTRKLLATRI